MTTVQSELIISKAMVAGPDYLVKPLPPTS